jgi:hypothetical protein
MNAETVARALGLRRAGREFTGRCPSCGYTSGFALCERNGAILVCCHAGGCSQAELWAALRQGGIDSGRDAREQLPSVSTANRRDSQAAALAIWRRSRPAQGTVVETYLRLARGYAGPIPAALRFAFGKHPSDLRRWHPMMVAAVLLDGRIVAVHRTFLRADGRDKAALDPDKMTLGRCKGAAVPLAPAGPALAITEGIETGLSVQAAGLATWAALSAAGIRNLILPEFVREVTIAADPDPAGLINARVAMRRWLAEGRSVTIARPPLGSDFNDLLRAAS